MKGGYSPGVRPSLLTQHLLNGQPERPVGFGLFFLEAQARRFLAGRLVRETFYGAEAQIPECSGQRAVLVVDEEGVVRRVVDDAVELVQGRAQILWAGF